MSTEKKGFFRLYVYLYWNKKLQLIKIVKDLIIFHKACIAWVKHEPPERKKWISKLLKHVRLPLMSR